jgi:hypothetical protein
VTNSQVARAHAALRVKLRLRQRDVAQAAGIGRWKVVKLEAGEIDELKMGEVRRSFDALGASVSLVVSHRGASLDRLLDEVHAALLGAVVGVLQRLGWTVKLEVSFSIRGERGSIDALAWKAAERALLVVEVKSEMPGVDPLLRPLDIKVRLAAGIARQQFGWHSETVSRVIVFPEDRTARRQVERHATVLGEALPVRSRAVRTWLRNPVGVIAGLWFLSLGGSVDTARNPSSILKVQRPRPRSGRTARGSDVADLRLIDPHRVGQTDN